MVCLCMVTRNQSVYLTHFDFQRKILELSNVSLRQLFGAIQWQDEYWVCNSTRPNRSAHWNKNDVSYPTTQEQSLLQTLYCKTELGSTEIFTYYLCQRCIEITNRSSINHFLFHYDSFVTPTLKSCTFHHS